MPKPEKFLVQIRLSDADRRRIKSFAAKQGLSLQDAVVVAFDSWAENLRGGSSVAKTKVATAQLPAGMEPEIRPERSWAWLTRAVQLDWAKCPEVELVGDGTNQYWMFRESGAPLSEVLGALADGIPALEVAEMFEVDLLRLAKVMEFAATPLGPGALN